jgi:hypothetical protein
MSVSGTVYVYIPLRSPTKRPNLVVVVGIADASSGTQPGRSGYPKSSGRVIRVLKNSGIQNCYPIRDKKNNIRKFEYPQFRDRVLPDLPEIYKMTVNTQRTHIFTKN